MVLLWLAVGAFYAVVLLVGLGVMVVATGSSVVLAFRRDRVPPLRRARLTAAVLLVLAGAAAVALALLWFGREGADVLRAAFATL
ncbi:hypothetical protein [Amnibacterium setariae]|uniref:Uncharacterized protein n=1 Tax=Amnibacterium setariae TaxID=2306585 RepID=A0A3A1TS38_9MICO|nr:hypothetical protein [Amnibacterium setariae]RIX26506.1 hypothetical protein D1781_16355 [Amnibacterium setariae]